MVNCWRNHPDMFLLLLLRFLQWISQTFFKSDPDCTILLIFLEKQKAGICYEIFGATAGLFLSTACLAPNGYFYTLMAVTSHSNDKTKMSNILLPKPHII